ncbi:7874_t:CDS:2 [Gigaspora margarita]|uniref:7874_t:CDS:1 n=1 Tax=Gigaspora margarita TaxID=4874 RepID=A0ABN7VLY1_GIGMA|nr:7874_t:CDS:2 [Gigaspora margarita]
MSRPSNKRTKIREIPLDLDPVTSQIPIQQLSSNYQYNKHRKCKNIGYADQHNKYGKSDDYPTTGSDPTDPIQNTLINLSSLSWSNNNPWMETDTTQFNAIQQLDTLLGNQDS